MEKPPPDFEQDAPVSLAVRAALGALARRHDHRVIGLENIPAGPCLLVVNHSLATYDILLLMLRCWEDLGRIPRGLGDKRIFEIPWTSRFASYFGGVRAAHRAADQLLDAGCIVLVAPGGMKEAIRPSERRYQLRWRGRRGFVKLALRKRVPIVLAACPRADDLYTVYRSGITNAVYRRLHIPVPLFKGDGWSLLPRSVKLVHRIGEPIQPPDEDPDDEAAVDAFHTLLTERMNELMEQTLAGVSAG